MKKILAVALVFFAFYNVHAEEQKLSQAYEQQLIEKVKSVFSPEAKPVEMERPICATPIFLEVKANWDRLSAKAKASLKTYIERPTYSYPEFVYNTPSGHFKVHYTREGDNAVYNPDLDYDLNGHPDWVDTIGMVLDHVWDTEVTGMGYYPPPSDGDYPDTIDNGGDGRYDIYLLNLGVYVLGYSVGELIVPSGPYSASATSYFVLDNDYSNSGHARRQWLEVTAAHEFFHAIQLGYDGTEYELIAGNFKNYWMEMSAVWMEEMVYDEVNDYLGYLSSFFDYPHWSLKTFSSYLNDPDSASHSYASCVWPMYLQEKFNDTTIIKQIWEECGKVPGNNAIDYPSGASATDIVLQSKGTTFEDAFREFTVWNYFTGNRAEPLFYYSEGDWFPQIEIQATHDFQTTDSIYSPSGASPPWGLGSNYVVFEPGEKQGGMKLSFAPASEEYDFELSAIGYNQNVSQAVEHEFQINHQTGFAEAEVRNWTSYNNIILIPASVERDGGSYSPYTYSAIYDSSLHGDQPFPQADWVGQNFPNPFVINNPDDVTYFPFILSSVSEVKIDIFSVAGERVWNYPPVEDKGQEWTIGEYTEPGKCPAWNGKNENGEYVAAGVYIYQVKTKNSTVIKQLAVIR